MLQGSTAILAGIMDGKEDSTIVEKRYNVQFVMSEFWSTIDIAAHRPGVHSEDNQYQIESIEYNKQTKALNKVMMSYWSPWYGERKTTIIEANQKNNLQMSTEWGRERIQALEKQKENLLANYMLKVIQGGANIAAGYVCPELAVLVSVANMGINGTAGTVSGADKLVSSELGKLGIKGSNVAASNIINYALQMNAVMEQLDGETYKTAMEWFGSGSVYEIDGEEGVAYAGLYDPKLLKNMVILNNEGLAGLMGLDPVVDKETIQELIDALNVSGEPQEAEGRIARCKAIISGDYEFFNETDTNGDGIPEYKVNLNSEFFSAIGDIDDAIKSVDKLERFKSGIRNSFFVGGSDKCVE